MPAVGDRVVVLQTETDAAWYALDTEDETFDGGGSGSGDTYVASAHFGKSQCFMSLDTTQTANQQFNDLVAAAASQDRIDLMPIGIGDPYYAKLRTRMAVSATGATMHAAIGVFVNAQVAGTSSSARGVLALSELTSSDPLNANATYVTQETDWLLLNLFFTNPTWGGFVTLFTWTDDAYQGFLLAAEIIVMQRAVGGS